MAGESPKVSGVNGTTPPSIKRKQVGHRLCGCHELDSNLSSKFSEPRKGSEGSTIPHSTEILLVASSWSTESTTSATEQKYLVPAFPVFKPLFRLEPKGRSTLVLSTLPRKLSTIRTLRTRNSSISRLPTYTFYLL